MKTLCVTCLLLMLCCCGRKAPDTFEGVLDSELIPTSLRVLLVEPPVLPPG